MSKGKIVYCLFLTSVVALSWLFYIVFTGREVVTPMVMVGPLTIRYYGFLMALATVTGFYFALHRAPAFSITREDAETLLFRLVLGGFIGARLYHVLSTLSYYTENPFKIFAVWEGGMSIYGVIIAGIITTLWYAWKRAGSVREFFRYADWLAPALLFGQVIGRLGNFFNYELYGYPTSLPWKMFVPLEYRHMEYLAHTYFHPLFLYEMVWNAVVLVFLLWWERRSSYKYEFVSSRVSASERGDLHPGSYVTPMRLADKTASSPDNPPAGGLASHNDTLAYGNFGQLFFFYILLYNLGRFFLEFLRIDSVFAGGIRVNAVVSLVFVLAAIFCLRMRKPHVRVP